MAPTFLTARDVDGDQLPMRTQREDVVPDDRRRRDRPVIRTTVAAIGRPNAHRPMFTAGQRVKGDDVVRGPTQFQREGAPVGYGHLRITAIDRASPHCGHFTATAVQLAGRAATARRPPESGPIVGSDVPGPRERSGLQRCRAARVES